MTTVGLNEVLLAGSISAHPIHYLTQPGSERTELRVRVPEDEGRRLLPLPVSIAHAALNERGLEDLKQIEKGDDVRVVGRLERRFVSTSNNGARSVTEVVASAVFRLS